MLENQKSRKNTSLGEIGIIIRTHASPKVGQDQVLAFRTLYKCAMETSRNWVNCQIW